VLKVVWIPSSGSAMDICAGATRDQRLPSGPVGQLTLHGIPATESASFLRAVTGAAWDRSNFRTTVALVSEYQFTSAAEAYYYGFSLLADTVLTGTLYFYFLDDNGNSVGIYYLSAARIAAIVPTANGCALSVAWSFEAAAKPVRIAV